MQTGNYSPEFKQAACNRIANRGNRSIDEILEELGISRSSAYKWIREFAKVPAQMKNKNEVGKSTTRAQWSGQEKFQAVLEFERLRDEPQQQGEFLRKSGLHSSLVESWRKEILGVLETPSRRSKRAPDEIAKDQKIASLERDLRRKDKALAETAALLVLKKKAESIWGLVDDEDNQ